LVSMAARARCSGVRLWSVIVATSCFGERPVLGGRTEESDLLAMPYRQHGNQPGGVVDSITTGANASRSLLADRVTSTALPANSLPVAPPP
jgi:hypothetical protein